MKLSVITKVKKLVLVIVNSHWRRVLFRYHVAASVEHISVISNISHLNTLVDIGANRGQFTLLVSMYYPSAKIFAFEPLPRPSYKFSQIFDKNLNVKLFTSAIGPSIKDVIMHISKRDDSSSLLPISKLQSDIFPGTEESTRLNVKVAPLSYFLTTSDLVSPSLLKLDVQGYEYEALCGCETLIDCFDYIYCECSYLELYEGQTRVSDVLSWLFARGYVLFGVYNTSYNSLGIAVQSDFLLVKSA